MADTATPPRKLPPKAKRPPVNTDPPPPRPRPTGSLKTSLRQLRQRRNLSQSQLAERCVDPDTGQPRYRQSDIQKFESADRYGRPITDEVRIDLEDAMEVPRGTLLRMAGFIDDLEDIATVGTDAADRDPWITAARRLFGSDPVLSADQADNFVELYKVTRARAVEAMPSGEMKRRRRTTGLNYQ